MISQSEKFQGTFEWRNEGATTAAISHLWRLIHPYCRFDLLAPENIFLPALISVTIIYLILELVRLKVPQVNRRFVTCFHTLLREREASTLTSSAYLLMAATIVFVFCDKAIAAMGIAFLAVGDPIAGMVRGRFRRVTIRGKSLAGSCVCLVVCLIIGAIVAATTHVALRLAVIGAICATVIEFLPLPPNDNLTIPLISCGIMTLAKFAAIV